MLSSLTHPSLLKDLFLKAVCVCSHVNARAPTKVWNAVITEGYKPSEGVLLHTFNLCVISFKNDVFSAKYTINAGKCYWMVLAKCHFVPEPGDPMTWVWSQDPRG